MQKQILVGLLSIFFLVTSIRSADLSNNFDNDELSAEEDQILKARKVLDEDGNLNFEFVGRPLARRTTFKRNELSAARRQTSSFTTDQRTFQQQMLDAHNKYRVRHCAQLLKLDDSISRSAQNYAQHLASINQMVHSGTKGLGENLYMKWSSAVIKNNNGAEATDSWYNEVKLYNFNSPGFSMATGHFTQVVWKSTQKLGAGFAFTRDGKSLYVVAQYSPPGNYLNEFSKNVSPAIC